MNALTLTTPALLFSAVSLILLAYTNRFLAYAALVRQLYGQLQSNSNQVLLDQIRNLRKRLYLIKNMQLLGVASLMFCVLSMLLIYIEIFVPAAFAFGLGLLLLIISLLLSGWEIKISVRALDLHLIDMEHFKDDAKM
ncbi:DUF2721 domain-containing protein [Carboxylicivirga sp. M1479]|uniref:DUF2721 domain-containing protein n=1 Tax=Carboxylicivirga sp. M1479 TaxID=2594476 RepID=UPI0011777C63|nr:DUF2721 domain-containing protein [Carboxylicivirga sp. M1479]TRX66055.1 DUF2721 domain-containing protein [Carboxylicivirga sp. M1479]